MPVAGAVPSSYGRSESAPPQVVTCAAGLAAPQRLIQSPELQSLPSTAPQPPQLFPDLCLLLFWILWVS